MPVLCGFGTSPKVQQTMGRIEPGGIDVNGGYPVAIPFDTYLKWYWKIKRWQFTGTFDVYDPSSHMFEFTGTIIPVDLPLQINPGIDAVDERHIIADSTEGTLGNLGNRHVGGVSYTISTGGTGSFNSSSFLGICIHPLTFHTDPNFYPEIDINLGEQVLGVSYFWGTTNPDGLSSLGTITIDGFNISIYKHTIPPGGAGFDYRNFNLTLTPIEFWEYSTSSGEPVYDSTTGAQLNNPFS